MPEKPVRPISPTPTRVYHVLSTLGKGGFGTVYRAELRGEGGFTKAVALKVLNADMAGLDEIAQRMRDEARVLGLVRHRAIVQVDGLVRLNGRWTIVMELVPGVDLKHLADAQPLPPGPALEIVGEIAAALHAAWTCPGPSGAPLHILHRDIKPSNVQLTALGEVKVLDFGISRADFEGREAVTRSLAFGSLEYMAPERVDQVDTPAGDIYALGAVLYELLAGQMLGKTAFDSKRHAERLEERLLLLQGRLGRDAEPLLDLVRALLAYDHEQRPDAREVERRCARLRQRWPAPLLRDWAEEVVPRVLAQRRELPPDELTGSTLHERTDSRSTVLPAAGFPEPSPTTPLPEATASRARPARSILPWLLASGVLAPVLVALAALGLYLALREPALDPPPAAPVVEVAVAPPEPPAATPPVPVAAPAAPVAEPVAAAPKRAPAVAPKEVHVEPTPAPAPEAPVGPRVAFSGDATAVTLLFGSESYPLPAVVPAGSYEIEATFPNRGRVRAGTVRVVAGAPLTLRCQDMFGRCTVE